MVKLTLWGHFWFAWPEEVRCVQASLVLRVCFFGKLSEIFQLFFLFLCCVLGLLGLVGFFCLLVGLFVFFSEMEAKMYENILQNGVNFVG